MGFVINFLIQFLYYYMSTGPFSDYILPIIDLELP